MIYLITMPLVLPIVGPSFDDGLDDVRQQWLTKGGLVWRHKGKGWLDRICPPIDIPTMQHNGYSGGRGAPCSSTGKWGVVGQVLKGVMPQICKCRNLATLIQHNPNSTPVILSRIIIELCANRNNRTHGLSGRTNLIGSRNDGYFCVGANKSVPERTAVLYRSWLDMF